jgi:O-6-methylguanine DNA methyltransferase
VTLPTPGLLPPCTIEWLDSPVGPLIVAATADAVCALEFSDADRLAATLHAQRERFAGSLVPGANPHINQLQRQLSEYFTGVRRHFTVPLAYAGTAFQEKVWSALRRIAYGQTWSYLDLALAIGDRGATRAVGTANGKNPIAIVIPCHRVINEDGGLGGYGGGLWRKRILLDLERGQGRLEL